MADSISAIPITFGIDGQTELGPISHLPEGARLQLCGEGFNEMTAKVWWEGRYYFVFLEDLQFDRRATCPQIEDATAAL